MSESRSEQLAIQQMFDDPNFSKMVENLRLEIFESWCKERKPDERELLYQEQKVLDRVVMKMRTMADRLAFERHRDGQ